MEIILHIGFPKTGSSAIQSHLNTNRGWFASRGVYIPRSGYSAGSGHNFIFGEVAGKSAPRQLQAMLPSDSALPELAEELLQGERQGYKRVLLSWEGLAHLDEALIESFRGEFSAHDITVLAYVREQSKLRQSSILQAIKVGRNPASVFSFLDDEHRAAHWSMDYFEILSRWRRVLGDGTDIRTRVYDRSVLLEGDVIADFVHWLGLELDKAFARQHDDVNQSLDFPAAAVLAMTRAAGMDTRGMSRLSSALARATTPGVSGGSSFLLPEVVNRIRADHAAGNKQFLAAFCLENDSPEPGSLLLPGPVPENLPPEDTVTTFARAVFEILLDKTPQVWHGEKLRGFALAKISSAVAEGWRLPEKAGIWAVGRRSKIAFQIPTLGKTESPRALVLEFTGVYTSGVDRSIIRVNGVEQTLDLSAAHIDIPIDDSLLEEGVRIELQHQLPDGASGDLDDRAPAFKLRTIAYEFQWEID
jgi:hypothetical protein